MRASQVDKIKENTSETRHGKIIRSRGPDISYDIVPSKYNKKATTSKFPKYSHLRKTQWQHQLMCQWRLGKSYKTLPLSEILQASHICWEQGEGVFSRAEPLIGYQTVKLSALKMYELHRMELGAVFIAS